MPSGSRNKASRSIDQPTLDDKPNALTSSTSASFTFSSEPGATIECKLDGAAFSGCASPKEYTGLASGEHTFEVRATDAVGNAEAPVSHSWTVDANAPQTTLLRNHGTDLYSGLTRGPGRGRAAWCASIRPPSPPDARW